MTGTLSASLALLGDAVDSASLYLNRADGGWPTTTGITEPLQIEPLADGFVELGNEDVLVYSAYGSKILSLQPSYARPVLAVGGTHFVVYNRAGSELTVCSRTRTLYTQRFDEDILLCAMSNNNSLAVVTDADRFAGWVHIYDPSMRELYSWRMPQSMGTPIALDFAPDNRRFASGMIAARDGQLNCSVYFMSLDSDTEGLLYTADAGSMLLRLDWQSENRVMAVFDTYIAVIDPRTAAEVARYDYGGAALQSVAPGPAPDRPAAKHPRRQQPGHPVRKPHRYVGDSRTAGVCGLGHRHRHLSALPRCRRVLRLRRRAELGADRPAVPPAGGPARQADAGLYRQSGGRFGEASRVVPKPSPSGEGGPAGPDEGPPCRNNQFAGNNGKVRPHQSAGGAADSFPLGGSHSTRK